MRHFNLSPCWCTTPPLHDFFVTTGSTEASAHVLLLPTGSFLAPRLARIPVRKLSIDEPMRRWFPKHGAASWLASKGSKPWKQQAAVGLLGRMLTPQMSIEERRSSHSSTSRRRTFRGREERLRGRAVVLAPRLSCSAYGGRLNTT